MHAFRKRDFGWPYYLRGAGNVAESISWTAFFDVKKLFFSSGIFIFCCLCRFYSCVFVLFLVEFCFLLNFVSCSVVIIGTCTSERAH